jgi:hypothetical protein
MKPNERDVPEKTPNLADKHEVFTASARNLIALEKATVETIERTRALIAELHVLLAKRLKPS